MARPIVIEFAANVRDFLRGTRDVERATDDIADSLHDATRDAERFERDFEQSMRDAERAADRSAGSMERDFDRAGDAMADVGKETGEEFKQNLGESIASGDLEDIFTDTLGGIISSLEGPVGAAAGLLAGVAALAFHEVRQQAERWSEGITGVVEALDESISAVEERMTNAQRLGQFNQWLEDNKDLLTEIEALAGRAGIEFEDIPTALFFGGTAADELIDKLEDVRAEGTQIVGSANNITETMTDSARAADTLLGKVEDTESATGRLRQQQNLVNDAYRAGVGYIDQQEQAFTRLGESYQRMYNRMAANNRIDIEVAYYDPLQQTYVNPGRSTSPSSSASRNIHQNTAR